MLFRRPALFVAMIAIAGLASLELPALGQESAPATDVAAIDANSVGPESTDEEVVDWMKAVDAWFGKYFVGPLATVLF
jgi:hypothetical protein